MTRCWTVFQGAIEGCSLGFSLFCSALFHSLSPHLCEIPGLLLNKVKCDIYYWLELVVLIIQ